MPRFEMTGGDDDGRPNYSEVVGGSLADVFKEGKPLRGSIRINNVDFRNFEANSPENFIAQINARYAETGVMASLDDGGNIKLAHRSDSPILLASGAPYQPARQGDTLPPADEKNEVLQLLGFDETTEENAAAAAQQLNANGLVPQVGDGSRPTPVLPVSMGPGMSPFQTAEEIEAANRAMMSNPRGINGPIGSGVGGRAPHGPHETVPGTLTTGNRPIPVEPTSNAERVVVQPGQETALAGQPLRADSVLGAASATAPTTGDANQQASQDGEKPDYDAMTIADAREYAQKNDIDLTGLTLKDDIISEIKKQDKKKAKQAQS